MAVAVDRLALIVERYQRLTGNKLIDAGGGLWSAARAIVAHGTEDDPIFFYGNAWRFPCSR